MTCRTPTNHDRNLNVELDATISINSITNSTNANTNSTNTNSTNTNSPTNNPTTLAKPPPNHLIVNLTIVFRTAILENHVFELDTAMKQYTPAMTSDPEFMIYDCTDLCTACSQAMRILYSNAASIELPSSPPSTLPDSLPTPQPSASFKPPKLVTDNWSGQSYDFYPWLPSALNELVLARCDNPSKVMLMNQASRLSMRGSLANIIDWPTYKARLIEEFGSIDIFGCDIKGVFKNLSHYQSVQEVAEDLAPKIKTLQANLEVVKQFHNANNLCNVALTPNLNHYIMKCVPTEVQTSFSNKYMEFQDIDPDNVRAPGTFQFIAQLVSKVEQTYRANPSLFDFDLSPLDVGIKPVQY